ncbi:MAG: glycosyltransferase family 4 protein [Candidatus Thiodiazotropha sp.]
MNNSNDKIKILVIARWPVGGIRTFFKYVFSKFDQDKYTFIFVLPHDSNPKELSSTLNIPLSNIHIVEKPASFFSFIRIIFKLIKNKEINLVNSHGFTAGLYALIPALITRTPHLMSVHFVFWKNYFEGIKGFAKKALLSVIFPLIDHIHCVSNDSKNSLVDQLAILKLKKNSIHVITNGIDTRLFSEPTKEDFYSDEIKANMKLIGYFGRFMPEKGFGYLSDAVSLLENSYKVDSKFKVLCFGWGGFIREEQKKLKLAGIDHLFQFMDYRENIAPSIRGLDMVVMPSLQEAGPLLPMETMVTGTPFIGTDCVGLREVLKDTPAYIVPAGNAEALAQAILKEINFSRRKDFEAFIKESIQRFEVKHRADELMQLIDKVISQGK